jgi:hypothetical protein
MDKSGIMKEGDFLKCDICSVPIKKGRAFEYTEKEDNEEKIFVKALCFVCYEVERPKYTTVTNEVELVAPEDFLQCDWCDKQLDEPAKWCLVNKKRNPLQFLVACDEECYDKLKEKTKGNTFGIKDIKDKDKDIDNDSKEQLRANGDEGNQQDKSTST